MRKLRFVRSEASGDLPEVWHLKRCGLTPKPRSLAPRGAAERVRGKKHHPDTRMSLRPDAAPGFGASYWDVTQNPRLGHFYGFLGPELRPHLDCSPPVVLTGKMSVSRDCSHKTPAAQLWTPEGSVSLRVLHRDRVNSEGENSILIYYK